VLLGDILTAMDGRPVAQVRDLLAGLDPESIGPRGGAGPAARRRAAAAAGARRGARRRGRGRGRGRRALSAAVVEAPAPPLDEAPRAAAPRGDGGEAGAAATIRVALRLADGGAARRLAGLAAAPPGGGTDPAGPADFPRVLVTDGAVLPGDPPAVVVLAPADAAARRALRDGAPAVLPLEATAAEVAAVLPAVARGFAVLPPGLLAALLGQEGRRRRTTARRRPPRAAARASA
jgi:hypothetical protein